MGYDIFRLRDGEDSAAPHVRRPGDYFRWNIWSMSEGRSYLADVGIVRRCEMQRPPDPDKFGITEAFDEDADNLTPQQQSYLEAVRQWRDGSYGDGPGIPSYKLETNDGWLVLPIEVRSGIGYADANHAGWREKLPDWVVEFVEWMERSEEGFRVW